MVGSQQDGSQGVESGTLDIFIGQFDACFVVQFRVLEGFAVIAHSLQGHIQDFIATGTPQKGILRHNQQGLFSAMHRPEKVGPVVFVVGHTQIGQHLQHFVVAKVLVGDGVVVAFLLVKNMYKFLCGRDALRLFAENIVVKQGVDIASRKTGKSQKEKNEIKKCLFHRTRDKRVQR